MRKAVVNKMLPLRSQLFRKSPFRLKKIQPHRLKLKLIKVKNPKVIHPLSIKNHLHPLIQAVNLLLNRRNQKETHKALKTYNLTVNLECLRQLLKTLKSKKMACTTRCNSNQRLLSNL